MLFVSTRDIGFVKIGQKVLLKYDAYPYQNFGLYESIVASIDDSALSQKDIDIVTPPDPSPAARTDFYSNKTFYRVIVTLKDQEIMFYGQPQPLTAGMTLVGEIIGDKRKIWQWILNPIYTLKGSLTSP
jgi:membrane fusion protein